MMQVAPAARPGSGRGRSFAEDVTEVCVGPADPPNRLVRALRWWSRSQRGAEVAGGGNFLRKGLTCGGSFASNSGVDGVRSRSSGSVRVWASRWG